MHRAFPLRLTSGGTCGVMGDEPTGPNFDAQGAAGRPTVEALYRRYADWLRRVLRRRFGAEAAEDLTQEAYLRLARFGGVEAVAYPQAMLLRIAVNAGLDQLRHNKRWMSSGGAAVHVADPCGEAAYADQLEALLLKQIVLSLPPSLRDVFVLSRFGGLSYEEIAERLGIAVKTVEWRMSKALAHCAEQIRPRL
jgi:RNA polymerase sigma factor (sigma-70 family)